jgi:hypothetical protein
MKADLNNQAKWRNVIELYKQGNLTRKEFCEEHNVKIHQIQYWSEKFRKQELKESSNFVKIKPNNQLVSNRNFKIKFNKLLIDVPNNFNENDLFRLLKVVDQIV